MSLLALPSEIHQLVISHVHSNQDVASISISCRTLRIVCDMETRKKFDRIRISGNDDSRNAAFALLMAILRRPRLGHYVHHIECNDPTFHLTDYLEREHQRDLSGDDIRRVEIATRKAGFTGPKQDRILNMLMQKTAANTRIMGGKASEYRDHATRGCFISQALAAILITVSPYLVSMTMVEPNGGQYDSPVEWPLLQLLRQTNADPESKPFLRNLAKVYIINFNFGNRMWDGTVHPHNMDFIRCFHLFDDFLSIESIRTFGLDESDVGIPSINGQGPSAISRLSRISRISLHRSTANSTFLAALISSCKILREFEYFNGGGNCSMNPKTLVKAICLHKKTLEVLNIDVDVVCERRFQKMESNIGSLDKSGGPLGWSRHGSTRDFLKLLWKNKGSLKDFVALKRLSIGIQTLLYLMKGVNEGLGENEEKAMLADSLPGGLNYLCIRGYERGKSSERDVQMDALKAFYDSGLSNLREIRGIDEYIPNSPPRRPGYD